MSPNPESPEAGTGPQPPARQALYWWHNGLFTHSPWMEQVIVVIRWMDNGLPEGEREIDGNNQQIRVIRRKPLACLRCAACAEQVAARRTLGCGRPKSGL